jgi:hypothetical protein
MVAQGAEICYYLSSNSFVAFAETLRKMSWTNFSTPQFFRHLSSAFLLRNNI